MLHEVSYMSFNERDYVKGGFTYLLVNRKVSYNLYMDLVSIQEDTFT